MSDAIEFVKMTGCGNDFIIIDAVANKLSGDLASTGGLPELARKLCARHTGVGADGLLIVEPDNEVDFSVRMFNSDGSEPEMCGNAARCLARFAKTCGLVGDSTRFSTPAGIIEAEIRQSDVKVTMTSPKGVRLSIPVEVGTQSLVVSFINTGVPHAVVFVDDIEATDVVELGRAIRFHDEFAPAGANVDFVQVIGPGQLKMRTYERGVEDETLACGTGAVAAAALARLHDKIDGETVTVAVLGGALTVTVPIHRDGKPTGATLAGEARIVYRGVTEEL